MNVTVVKSPQLLWSSSMGPNAVLLSSATRPWAGWSSGGDVLIQTVSLNLGPCLA